MPLEGRGKAWPLLAMNVQAVGAALADALSERQRQLDTEGWMPQHDDQYCDNAIGGNRPVAVAT